MPNWKKIITSGSDAILSSLETTGNIVATGSVKGNQIIAGTSNGSFTIDSKNNNTDTSGTVYGIRGITNVTAAGASTVNTYAIGGRLNYTTEIDGGGSHFGNFGFVTSTNGRPNVLGGVDAYASYTGDSSSIQTGSLYGLRTQVAITNGGYYNHMMGLKINAPLLTNGSSTDGLWGIYIEDIDITGSTTYKAIHINGTGVNNGIGFSNGTNIYESGSSGLKTDGDFTSTGDVESTGFIITGLDDTYLALMGGGSLTQSLILTKAEETPLLTGNGIYISGASPRIDLREIGAATDEGNIRLIQDGGDFEIRLQDDSNSSLATVFKLTRNVATASSMDWTTTDFNVSNDFTAIGEVRGNRLTGRTEDGSNISLQLGRTDSSSYWNVYHAGNDFRLSNNDGTGSDIMFGVDPTGNDTLNNVTIGTTSNTERLNVTGSIISDGYKLTGLDDTYIALMGGGTKSLSDFSPLITSGSIIDLSSVPGNLMNMSSSYSGSFTLSGAIDGGNAMVYVDTTGMSDFPPVAGSTLVNSAAFEASKDFYLLVLDNSDRVEHSWIRRSTSTSSVLENIVEDTTPQLGGELDLNGHSIGGAIQTTTGDGTTTIDWKLGNMFDFTFSGSNELFTFTAPSKPGHFQLKCTQDLTGSRTASFPATVKTPAGAAPTFTAATSSEDIFTFYYNGSSYYLVEANNFLSII